VEGQVFAGAFQSGNYGPPGGFCFDDFDCNDEPIQSNPKAPDYNLPQKVRDFIRAAKQQAAGTAGDVSTQNVMFNMGRSARHCTAPHCPPPPLAQRLTSFSSSCFAVMFSDFQHEQSEMWMTNLGPDHSTHITHITRR
jgi:hypothetical protein